MRSKIDAILFQLLQIGTVAMVIGVPLYPKFPLIQVPGTYVSIRLEDFVIAVTAIIWIAYMRKSIFNLLQNRVIQAIALFLAVGTLATLNAIFITQSVELHLGLLHLFRRFEYLAAFFFVYTAIRKADDAQYFLRVFLITNFLIVLYGMGQKFLEFPIISTMNKEYSQGIAQSIISGGRINATFAGHYDLAAYSVMAMSILFGLFIASRGFLLSRIWIFINILGAFWLLISSSSRISFAAYLGSITLTLWFLRKRLWIPVILGISFASSIFAPDLITRYADTARYEFAPRLASVEWPWEQDWFTRPTPTPMPTPTPTRPPVQEPTEPIDPTAPKPTATPTPTPTVLETPSEPAPPPREYVALPEDRSTAIRFEVEWPRAIRAFLKNPLLGTGYSSITLATDNDYLRALGEAGFLGLASFMLIFVTLFNQIKSSIFSEPKSWHNAVIIGISGATLGFLANALFIDVFEASKVAILYWIIAALMLRIHQLKTEKNPRKSKSSK